MTWARGLLNLVYSSRVNCSLMLDSGYSCSGTTGVKPLVVWMYTMNMCVYTWVHAHRYLSTRSTTRTIVPLVRVYAGVHGYC